MKKQHIHHNRPIPKLTIIRSCSPSRGPAPFRHPSITIIIDYRRDLVPVNQFPTLLRCFSPSPHALMSAIIDSFQLTSYGNTPKHNVTISPPKHYMLEFAGVIHIWVCSMQVTTAILYSDNIWSNNTPAGKMIASSWC